MKSASNGRFDLNINFLREMSLVESSKFVPADSSSNMAIRAGPRGALAPEAINIVERRTSAFFVVVPDVFFFPRVSYSSLVRTHFADLAMFTCSRIFCLQLPVPCPRLALLLFSAQPR